MNNPSSIEQINSIASIAMINDKFRKGNTSFGKFGGYCLTDRVTSLSFENFLQLIQLIREFNNFNSVNDPYGEHDYGQVYLNDEEYFFKIDLTDGFFNRTMTIGHCLDQ